MVLLSVTPRHYHLQLQLQQFTMDIVGETWDRDATTQRLPNLHIGMIKTMASVTYKERLLIDSGAQCCVCPSNYAPEAGIMYQKKEDIPGLHSVAGENMTVYGLKCLISTI